MVYCPKCGSYARMSKSKRSAKCVSPNCGYSFVPRVVSKVKRPSRIRKLQVGRASRKAAKKQLQSEVYVAKELAKIRGTKAAQRAEIARQEKKAYDKAKRRATPKRVRLRRAISSARAKRNNKKKFNKRRVIILD